MEKDRYFYESPMCLSGKIKIIRKFTSLNKR